MTDSDGRMTDSELMIKAAECADWGQVVCNGGPPCFHIEGDRFCLRAKRWDGHDVMHTYVPLHVLLAQCAASKTKDKP